MYTNWVLYLPNLTHINVFSIHITSGNQQFLVLDQDEEGNFYVEGIKVILKDIMGTNGVIHIIDDVLIPETAKSVNEALHQKGRTTLKELFDLAGINEENGLSNVTIFGPSEEVGIWAIHGNSIEVDILFKITKSYVIIF